MKRDYSKREKRIKLFMTFFIVAIMILSVLGFMIGRNSNEQLKYNDFKFTNKNNKFIIKINNKDLDFDYFPSQVENFNISNEVIEKIKGKIQIDATSNFNDDFAESIAYTLFDMGEKLKILNIHLRKGFTTNTSYNKPIITCNNAKTHIPVIMFEKSDKTVVYEENNCIIIKAGSQQDIIAVKDRILYSFFGIIN